MAAVSFYIANALGDHIDDPTEAEMRRFLNAIDTSDEEHGAGWLSTDAGHTLEWSAAVLVFSGPGFDPPSRHMREVPREQALGLWVALARGDLATVERCDWHPGNGHIFDLARDEKTRAWQLEQDRNFYNLLGAERADVPCRSEVCKRGAIQLSVLCRVHHFESVKKRPSPFTD
jgi:hypothetical protein